MKTLLSFLSIAILSFSQAAAQWTRLSETTGWAQSMCVHQGTTLVMASRTGIFHSTDLGTTWISPQYDTLQGFGSLSLTSDGVNLYAARGTGGVTRSTDNGATWRSSRVGLPVSANAYGVHAGQGRVFAGMAFSGGVYASTNGGVSWFRSDSGMTTTGASVFASKGDTIFSGDTQGHVHRSTDGGRHWQNVSPGSYTSNTDVLGIMIVDSTVLLGASSSFAGLLRSSDWGATWTPFAGGLNEANPDIAGFARVDTTLFTGLYMGFGHGGIFRGSLNTSWTNVSSDQMIGSDGPPRYYIPAWSFAAIGTTVFAGMSAYGLYRSTDLGGTWQQITSDIYGVSEVRLAFFSRGDTLYAGGSGSGVFISTDNGAFWTEHIRNLPSSVSGISSFTETDSFLFEGNLTTGGIAKSSDGGRSWRSSGSGLGSFSITRLAVSHPAGGGHKLFAGTSSGLYTSTNNGASWSGTDWGTGEVKALHVRGGTVLAARLYEIWRSSDYGVTWTKDSVGIPNLWTANDITTISSRWYAAGIGGASILTSTDDGVSWTNISGPIASPAGVLATCGDTLYATNSNFLHFTTDAGANWTMVPTTGIQGQFAVRAMMVRGGFIYVGMGTQGAWRRPVPIATSVVEQPSAGIPLRMALEQNYPNPFNPTTTLSFSLPLPDRVSLAIYDVLGREVATIVDNALSAGSYEVPWDASGMTSGVYFYRLSSADQSITRKMLLIR